MIHSPLPKVVGLLMAIAISVQCLADDAPPVSSQTRSALTNRERIGLNLAGAELVVAAAKAKAVELHIYVNIAVVDDGGHLLAFARMDDARPASIATAITKATAAATTRQPTGPIRRGDAESVLLLNLSLQHAAATSGGKMTALLGGLPILVEGQVVGAIGVGGGTGEQDVEVAKTGIEAFQKALSKSSDSPTKTGP